MSDRLATARWEDQATVSQRYPFADGKFWLGRAEDGTAIGYQDDRHICLVSGTRGGKGTSVIVNNLCFWPGSAVVVDPKGENATVTAARRGQGSEHCAGMGQAVHVLDPFNVTVVDDCYRSSFNPFDALDPDRDETIDEASRLANAIVVVKDGATEPFWDESARTMVRGLILHVLTAPQFSGLRNLITLRNLVQRGAWEIAEAIRELGKEEMDPPHLLLWRSMELNPVFDSIVVGIGTQFRSMMVSSPKTFQGVLQAVANHTEFLDSPGMRRVLARSDFKLSELKTKPEGMTLYLSLPQRYMDTHYRWLRMMVALTTTQMEITRGQPATGHRVLMVLDEFAGLKRMTSIESAVAQIAGHGVKLLFVLQSLEQLKGTYKDHWETFLANAGLKIFFSIDDHFTREYVSKLVGETEIIRELQSANESQSESDSVASGRSQSKTLSKSVTRGTSKSVTQGTSLSQTEGTSRSLNNSRTEGINQSHSSTESFGTNESMGWSRGRSGGSSISFGPGGMTTSYSSGGSSSTSGSKGTSHGISQGTSEGTSSSLSTGVTDGTSRGDTHGKSSSYTAGTSYSETEGSSETTGTSQTSTHGSSNTSGTGRSESIHRRPLLQPDEIGRHFTRIDDKTNPAYPGFALVILTGVDPLVLKRTHYFEDFQFIDCFSPHPDHSFLSPVANIVQGIRVLINTLEAAMNGKRLTIARWFLEPGKLTIAGQPGAMMERVPPDDRTVHISVPYSGKVSETAATDENRLPSGEWEISDWLFTVKNYGGENSGIDAFSELREACRALELWQMQQQRPVAAQPTSADRGAIPWFLVAAALPMLIAAIVVGGFYLVSNSRSNEHTSSVQRPVPYTPGPTTSGATKPALASAPTPTMPALDTAARETSASRDIESILLQAKTAQDRNDLTKAMGFYRTAAEMGNPEGIRMACFDAFNTINFSSKEKLDAQSDLVKWCRKGADLGDGFSMYMLAAMYQVDGGPVPQDTQKAITLLKRVIVSPSSSPELISKAQGHLRDLGVLPQ